MKALASRLDEGRAAWSWSITASSSRLSRSVQEPGAATCCSPPHLFRLNSQWYLHSGSQSGIAFLYHCQPCKGQPRSGGSEDDSVKIWTADGVIIKYVTLESAATNRIPLPGDHAGAQQEGGEGGPEPGQQQGHQHPHPPGYRSLVELS